MENAENGNKNAVVASRLLDVESVASLLQVSVRHVYRLSDSGRMPNALKLGASRRWDRAAIETWISEGCPTMSAARKGASRR